VIRADASSGRTGIDRVDAAGPRLDGQSCQQALGRERRCVLHECGKDRLIVFGQPLDDGRSLDLVPKIHGMDRGGRAPGLLDVGHGEDARRQSTLHLDQHRGGVCACPVDLVDEDQRRDTQSLERAKQQRGLWLHSLDRRDDQDRPVEDAEDPFDLGDEVGMAGCVDEVDGQVADEERRDRRADGDAAFAFEIEGVGLGGAGVDAADVVDRAGGEEETLGEGGLTGVDVGKDAQVERAHGTSCRARRY
jgi:hypothetical protein